MKIQVKIGDLVEQVTQVAITIDRKAPDMPSGRVYFRALKRIKEGAEPEPILHLFSTNQASKTSIPLKIHSVEEEGEVLIDPAKLLGALVGRDQEQLVELAVLPDKTRTRVKIGKNIAHLPYVPAVESITEMIKLLPRPGAKPVARISPQILIEFIRRSSFCIPVADNGQQKFAMGVLNFSADGTSYHAQAIDGYAVAKHCAKQPEGYNYKLPHLLIPVEALDPLQKLVQCHKDDETDVEILGTPASSGQIQEIFFRMQGAIFGTVLRTGAQPAIDVLYEQHKPTFELEVLKEELKSALTRATNFIDTAPDKRGVTFIMEGDVLRIESINPLSDLKDEVAVTVGKGTAQDIKVSVNIDYIGHTTNVHSGDKVTLGLNSDVTKALSANDLSGDLESRYLIMPLKQKPAPKDAAA